MEALEKSNLVTIQFIRSPRITFRYALTERGKEIAEKLDDILGLIDT
jgi:DNA-binding HxlR family transcriptional regulator